MKALARILSERKPELGKPNVSFTGAKLDWLTAGRRIPPSYFKIGFYLVQHLNKTSGKGFPSEEWLAELTETSVSTVKRAVKFFEDGRWLNVERKRTYDYRTRTWKTRNTYSMRPDNVQSGLDEVAVMQRKRRLKGVTGDTLESDNLKGVTGEPLTPSKRILPIEKKGKNKSPPLMKIATQDEPDVLVDDDDPCPF